MPDTLYDRVVEVEERITIYENTKQVSDQRNATSKDRTITGEQVRLNRLKSQL